MGTKHLLSAASSRTHLVIHVGAAGAEAQFYSWETTGPTPWNAKKRT